MFPHSAERLAQTPEPLWDVFPCCPMIDEERKAKRPVPYAMPASWQQLQSERVELYHVAHAELVGVELAPMNSSLVAAVEAVPLAGRAPALPGRSGYAIVAEAAPIEDTNRMVR